MEALALAPDVETRAVIERNPEHPIVLVVDDDQLLQRSFDHSLSSRGYRVLGAEDGATALAIAAQLEPDAIILDLGLPDVDGLTVCRELRSRHATRKTPIVLLTGYTGDRIKAEGLEAGANEFISKPADPLELEIRLRNLIELRRAAASIESSEQTIFQMARLAEAKDPDTWGHCERLATMAIELGPKFQLSDAEIETLRRGAFLHDIGKLGVPDEILKKPGALSQSEMNIMRQHVEIGFHILSPLTTLEDVIPIVRCHHERLDGSGYPRGLRGDEIPKLVRIFQLFDIYDSLTNDRCYRKAMSQDEALHIMANEVLAGWWDPALFARFIRSVRRPAN